MLAASSPDEWCILANGGVSSRIIDIRANMGWLKGQHASLGQLDVGPVSAGCGSLAFTWQVLRISQKECVIKHSLQPFSSILFTFVNP